MTAPADGPTIARQRIAEEAAARTGTLDLGLLGLDGLPDALFELTHLRRLYLGFTRLNADGQWERVNHMTGFNLVAEDLHKLRRLPQLEALSVSRTDCADLAAVGELSGLQSLDCGGTKVSDLAPLAGLTRLKSLDCFGTKVSDLAPLAGLTGLQSLECGSTKVSDLAPLAGLAGLQKLKCGWTSVSDLAPLAGLTGLQSLRCEVTKVWDLAPLAGLTGLQSLHCGGTLVSDLAPLAGLTGLQFLDCDHTWVSDLTPLAGLTGLQSLDCSRTSVSELAPLSDLPNLKQLRANACRIETAPPDRLWRKPSLHEVRLFGASVPGLPAEVLSQDVFDNCLPRIRAHLDDLAAGAETVRDVKLLVLGNGGAGKTQLSRRLRGEAFDPAWNSTHGIRITTAELPGDGDGPGTRLNVWDFGGQDIYHGTHALFVRSRAVCLLVWALDTERPGVSEHDGIRFRNYPLQYWVDYVRHVVGDASPTVIAQTKCDAPGDGTAQTPVDRGALDAITFMGEVQVSASTPRGLRQLRAALQEAVDALRTAAGPTQIGAGRLRVQRRIEALRNADGSWPPDWRLLDRATFDHWCNEDGGVSSPDHLLDYLHNAGVVFYRPGLFHDRIVLDHAWALNAIYAVFDRERSYKRLVADGGRFDRPRLAGLVWDVEEQRLFLEMMRSCGICFVVRGPEDLEAGGDPDDTVYIAPDLLPERARVQVQLDDRWGDGEAEAEATYSYPLLHPGLIRALIARIGEDARQQALYWHGGVYVYERTTRSRALIEQQIDAGDWSGSLRLQTKDGDAQTLLSRLMEWVEEQNTRLGLSPAVSRPEPARPRAQPADRQTELSFGAEPVENFTYCVSYAWGDDTPEGRDREAYVDALCERARQRGERVLRDKEHMRLGERIPDFMRKIGAGPRVFVFLSDTYLRSDNCCYELYEAWRTSQMDEQIFSRRVRVFVLPDAGIFDEDGRDRYRRYWQNRIAEQDRRYRARLLRDIPESVHARHGTLAAFADQIPHILEAIAIRLQPRTWEEFVAYGFQDPPDRAP